MSKTIPTIGDHVVYHTTQGDRDIMAPYGNTASVLPAVVVASWSDDCVNLKVICDSACPDIWVTSSIQGQGEMGWEWPGHYEWRTEQL